MCTIISTVNVALMLVKEVNVAKEREESEDSRAIIGSGRIAHPFRFPTSHIAQSYFLCDSCLIEITVRGSWSSIRVQRSERSSSQIRIMDHISQQTLQRIIQYACSSILSRSYAHHNSACNPRIGWVLWLPRRHDKQLSFQPVQCRPGPFLNTILHLQSRMCLLPIALHLYH